MAIYHCSAQVISRGRGRSAVAAVAYRSGTVLENEYDGLIHDFRKKRGVIGEGILMPEHVPVWYADRSTLWNEIEMMERANAQLAREFETSIPNEIPEEERVDYAFRLVAEVFVKKGLICDVGVHDRETDGTPNPHVHVTCPMRSISADGTWEAKSEQVYICKNAAGKERELTKTELAMPENAEWMKQHRYSVNGDPKRKKIFLTEYEVTNNPKYKDYKRVKGDRQPKTAKYGRKNPTMEYWDSKEFLMEVRKDVADFINAELEARGFDVRVDHRSLKDQGIDREPTIHEGYAARKMEREGLVSERCETNRQINAANAETAVIDQEISAVEMQIGAIQEDMQWSGIHQEASEIKEIIWDGSWSEAAQQAGLDRLQTLIKKTEGVKEEQSKSPFHVGSEIEGTPYIDFHASKAKEDQTALSDSIKANTDAIQSIPIFENFQYGTDPLWKVNDKIRATKDSEGKIQLVDRTPAEQAIILDAKKADYVLMGRIHLRDLKDLVDEQNKARKYRQPAGDQTALMIRQIQDDFVALRFVERHGIKDSEEARRVADGIEYRYRRQYGTIRRLEAQLKKLQNQEVEIRTGRSQGNLRQIYAEIKAIEGKIEAAKNQLPELNREVKDARFCVATFDRMEGRVPEKKGYERSPEAQKKNQDFDARQGMWGELKSCNDGFWMENKRLSQLYKGMKNDGFEKLKEAKKYDNGKKNAWASNDKKSARDAITAANNKQAKLNLFREVYRTYATAAKTALLNGMNEDARFCLDQLQELKARQVGYTTGDIVLTTHSWVGTQEWELTTAEKNLRDIERRAKEIEAQKASKEQAAAVEAKQREELHRAREDAARRAEARERVAKLAPTHMELVAGIKVYWDKFVAPTEMLSFIESLQYWKDIDPYYYQDQMQAMYEIAAYTEALGGEDHVLVEMMRHSGYTESEIIKELQKQYPDSELISELSKQPAIMAQKIADLREAALVEYSKSLAAKNYTPDPTYRNHVTRLTLSIQNIRKYEAEAQKYAAEIKKLGLFQGKQKKALEQLRRDVLAKLEDEERKVDAIGNAYGFKSDDLARAESIISVLMERSREEERKAALAKQAEASKERYEQLRADLEKMVRSIPPEDRKAVLDELEAMPKATIAEPGKKESVSVSIERSKIQNALKAGLGNEKEKERGLTDPGAR